MRRWLRRAAALLAGALITTVVGAAWLAFASLPRTEGTLAVAGLRAPVSVTRDAWGVPTIEAQNEADLYAAVGFVHAQDRLWQMAFNRRTGQGRLAEVLGSAGLRYDRFLRTLGLARVAEASIAGLDRGTRDLLDAYARGVNAFLATRAGPLPPEFQLLWDRPEPWRPADTALALKLVALDLGGNWRQELLRAEAAQRLPPELAADLWPAPEPGDPATYERLAERVRGLPLGRLAASVPPAPEAEPGSNVWVIGGGRTAEGAPLLANDPHLALSLPAPWYLIRLRAPGLELAGATLPGVPFLVLGQSAAVAWGVTNPGVDTQDLFVERTDPADTARYLTPDGPRPFDVWEEAIVVRGREPLQLRVRATRHGPVVSDVIGEDGSDRVLALAWTALQPDDRTLEAGFAAGRASDVTAFASAFESFASPPLNLAAADRAGMVGMFTTGAVPVRRGGDGRLPVDGASGANDWIGMVPPDGMPQAFDPPAGWLANANNRLVGADYPWLLASDWDAPWRAQRIRSVLAGSDRLDLPATRRLQLDLRSILWEALAPWLLQAEPADAAAAEVRARLAAWDGEARPERPEALVFWAWIRALQPLLWDDELGPFTASFGGSRGELLRRVFAHRRQWCDDRRTPAPETCAALSTRAFARALDALRAAYGEDVEAWRWDGPHRAVLAHRPFDEVPGLAGLFSRRVPVGGDSSTVNVAHVSVSDGAAAFTVRHAATYRGLYDTAAPARSRFVIAGGQSGHPLSRHYTDQLNLWRRGDYLPAHGNALSTPGLRLQLIPAD